MASEDIETHVLHKKVGDFLIRALAETQSGDLVLYRDPACGGDQHIPLFLGKKSRATRFCNVDALITKCNKVKVIIEIEESDVKPTKVCGKFLTSALCDSYQHERLEDGIAEFDSNTLFIQIVDYSKLKEGTRKKEQWDILAKAIKDILPLKGSSVADYKLFVCNPYEDDLDTFENVVISFLKASK